MSAVVKIFQIYYNEETKKLIDPEYIPYYNYPTSKYFEAKVMVDLVNKGEHKDCDWFGVVGCNLRDKLHTSTHWGPRLRNNTIREFSPKAFEEQLINVDPDIATFTTHPPHSIFLIAKKYHPRIIEFTNAALKRVYAGRNKFERKDMTRQYPHRPFDESLLTAVSQKPIYFNYFVTRPEIYEMYVKEMLEPFINITSTDSDLVSLMNQDSGYRQPLEDWRKEWLMKQFGLPYYPYYPFITERLINTWLLRERKNYLIFQW